MHSGGGESPTGSQIQIEPLENGYVFVADEEVWVYSDMVFDLESWR